MNETRTLCQLLRRDQSVYLTIRNHSLWEIFIRQALSEGFEWQDKSDMREKRPSDLVALRSNMTIGYAAGMSTRMMLHDPDGRHIRVDFGRYINGAEDYSYWPPKPESLHPAAKSGIMAKNEEEEG